MKCGWKEPLFISIVFLRISADPACSDAIDALHNDATRPPYNRSLYAPTKFSFALAGITRNQVWTTLKVFFGWERGYFWKSDCEVFTVLRERCTAGVKMVRVKTMNEGTIKGVAFGVKSRINSSGCVCNWRKVKVEGGRKKVYSLRRGLTRVWIPRETLFFLV
jgi:hypothetical protein